MQRARAKTIAMYMASAFRIAFIRHNLSDTRWWLEMEGNAAGSKTANVHDRAH